MRLLLDENLSPRLVRQLGDLFPDAAHVSSVGLERGSDAAVWDFARDHEYTIVTKDADFNDLSVLRGHPPKVIWLRLGNCTTAQVEAALRRQREVIEAFGADPEAGILTIV